MTAGMIIIGIVGAALALAVILGIKIVPQGENDVVERLGRYHRTLRPGLNFIVPFIDSVVARVSMKEQVLDIAGQEVITKDNVVIIANAVAFIQVAHPDRAIYGIEDYELGIVNLVQTTLRSIIGEIELDAALSSRDEIRARLKAGISDNIADWGIVLKNVEIQDIRPSATMQQAMEEQAAAERRRRATVTAADGEKQAAILEAEGKLEAARREAEAKVALAEADRKAIRLVGSAIGEQALPAHFLVAGRYVKAMEALGASENAKTILLPADLLAAVQGLLGKEKG
ncbi:MAG: paraslipin [Zetaproteobacteria bacterium]|nr:MAG: paraslipin [Zetaproteobacteria bacterium]